ncbi:unnamed protein product, partial [Sphacelaria rigidula]
MTLLMHAANPGAKSTSKFSASTASVDPNGKGSEHTANRHKWKTAARRSALLLTIKPSSDTVLPKSTPQQDIPTATASAPPPPLPFTAGAASNDVETGGPASPQSPDSRDENSVVSIAHPEERVHQDNFGKNFRGDFELDDPAQY